MGTFYGFWACNYCGRENSGKDRECKGCGHPRDANTKFYPVSRGDSKKPREYITDYKNSGPDWNCSYCGSMNPAKKSSCKGCGHTREESDKHYFEIHPERKAVREDLSDFDDDSDAPKFNDIGFPIEEPKHASDPAPEPKFEPNAVRIPSTVFDVVTEKSQTIKWLIIAVLAILSIIGLLFILRPKFVDITVIDKAWERNVIVEEYRTFHEEDWSIPIGGRETGSHSEIHHYDQVLDHYETVTKTRTVQSGGHYEVTGYQDNGDGTFTEVERFVPDYTTETYTEQEPVYISVPVYQTEYEYDIERWTFDHYETTSGHTDKPYFAEVDLPKGYRTNGTTESYKITATYPKKDETITKDFQIDFDKWQEISIGDEFSVKIHVGNRLEFIEN